MLKYVFPCGMSRSGTTLLTTLLDSHPDVSMGYELLPVGLPPIATAIELLRELGGDDSSACAAALRDRDQPGLATFVQRCGRTCVTPAELATLLETMRDVPDDQLDSIPVRCRLSMAVVEHKAQREDATWCGFKINAPSVEAFHVLFREAAYVYIVRDPRDVVVSHRANGFDRSLEHICHAWVQYADRFLRFQEAYGDQATIIHYEDLVTRPDAVIGEMLDRVGLPFRSEVRRFYASKASVHEHGHTNVENLQRDFFTSSMDRWVTELPHEEIRAIESSCGEMMRRLGYRAAPLDPPAPIPSSLKKPDRFRDRRRFFRDEYDRLVIPYMEGRVNLTWAEAARRDGPTDREILILRHDVDHDYETALQMARCEHQCGLRATYCILPSAWYYGTLSGGQMRRFREMLDCCLELQDLGHEINLHNNFVVMGLQTGLDPRDLLLDELRFLRLHGITIDGTSTHGDKLCRELDFRNFELFSESVYESRGGRRTLSWEGNTAELGAVSMADFGLEYEAYDLPRDLYLTDSGGTLRQRTNTRGRAGLRRAQLPNPPPYPFIVGILTHPVWWDFSRDAPPERAEAGLVAAADHD